MRATRTLIAVGFAMVVAALPALAADLGSGVTDAGGLSCGDPLVGNFNHIWEGHFSGGRSYYPGPGASIQLDWHDEKLCFPTLRTCNRHIATMRRSFHRPEGYFTCLPIR